jgi:hypothetical protein
MRRRIAMTLAAAAVAVAAPLAGLAVAFADDQPTANASVVKVDRQVPPRHKVVHRTFKPWAKPSRRQVATIIRVEARRWKIDPRRLARRVACESRFHWWASNGRYQGLLQFGYNAFARGLHTIRDRRVKLVRERVRKVHEARVEHYSDGTAKRMRGKSRRQRVYYVYTGKLPRRPAMSHGWSQLRIGAQAIRGISAVRSSEWSCGA